MIAQITKRAFIYKWYRFSQCWPNIDKEIIEFVIDEFFIWGYQIFSNFKSALYMGPLVLVNDTFYDNPRCFLYHYYTQQVNHGNAVFQQLSLAAAIFFCNIYMIYFDWKTMFSMTAMDTKAQWIVLSCLGNQM